MIKIKENKHKNTFVEFCTHELTFLSESGQPYRGVLFVQYITEGKIVDLISLKKYIESLRSRSMLLEDVAGDIYDDINKLLQNSSLGVTVNTTARGGISSTTRHGTSYDLPVTKPIVFGN